MELVGLVKTIFNDSLICDELMLAVHTVFKKLNEFLLVIGVLKLRNVLRSLFVVIYVAEILDILQAELLY